jgi:hypothetical protein
LACLRAWIDAGLDELIGQTWLASATKLTTGEGENPRAMRIV